MEQEPHFPPPAGHHHMKPHHTQYVLGILLLVAVLGLGYMYRQNRMLMQPAAADAQAAARAKNLEIFQAVAKLMLLPNDPQTVVATISDKEKLKGQKFFDLAQNGDHLIIVPSLSKAIIYRPSVNKIIDVGPYATQQKPAVGTSAKPAGVKTQVVQ